LFLVPLGRLERPTRGLGMRSGICFPVFLDYNTASFEVKIAY